MSSLSGGALSAPARCFCEPHFTGASCEVQGDGKPARATLELALPEMVTKVWRANNPALAGLILEAPMSMVVNICGVLLVLVASALGCWSLDKGQAGRGIQNVVHGFRGQEMQPEHAAVQRVRTGTQQSNSPGQQSIFFRYPGGDCSAASMSAAAPLPQRPRAAAHRGSQPAQTAKPSEAWVQVPAAAAVKSSRQPVQDAPEYLDDPDDFGADGIVDDAYEDAGYRR